MEKPPTFLCTDRTKCLVLLGIPKFKWESQKFPFPFSWRHGTHWLAMLPNSRAAHLQRSLCLCHQAGQEPPMWRSLIMHQQEGSSKNWITVAYQFPSGWQQLRCYPFSEPTAFSGCICATLQLASCNTENMKENVYHSMVVFYFLEYSVL